MPGGPDVQHMPDPSSMSVSLSLSFLVSSPTTMKSAMKCVSHCELQESCFFDVSGYTHETEVHVMIRGFANVLFPTYPQTSDGQEPHGQDSLGHYIHIRFVFWN